MNTHLKLRNSASCYLFLFIGIIFSFYKPYSVYSQNFIPVNSLPISYVLPASISSFFTKLVDNPVTYTQDLSSSYNERGYYKSNSAFGDGDEIINDFNGNLMYSIPIAKSKGKGDLVYDFTLNYNSNVNYNVITNDATSLPWTFGSMNIYNINAPGWVFSVNGLAVQMLNFETKFLTSAPNGNTAYGYNVRLLASGYNITNMMTTPSGINKDKITIMLGDGSTETLENIAGAVDVGEYRSISKGSYLRAKVLSGIPNQYYRIMYLMKGDGLTYIYKENYLNYTDIQHTTDGLPEWFKPKVFYLTEISDRFGNSCNLIYTGIQGKNIGRLWLNSIAEAGISVSYLSQMGLYKGLNINTSDGNYRLSTSTFSDDAFEDHRPTLDYILNPTNEKMSFGYNLYERSATGLTHINEGDFNISIGGNQSPSLNRLSRINGFDGGIRKYEYVPDYTTISFDPPEYQKSHSPMSFYKGYGRDVFFTNMLSKATVNDGINDIREVNYSYVYNTNRSDIDIWTNPIDSMDICLTTKTINSLKQDYDYDTPQINQTIKYYKIYKTRPVFTGEALDFNGTIKLINDEFYTGSEQTFFKKIDYSYYKGDNNVYCDGSMLEKSIVESINGASKEVSYAYTYNSEYGFLDSKEETDPFGRKTLTEFDYFYKENFEVFDDGIFIVAGYNPQQYRNIYFYLIHQPRIISIIKNNEVLKKTHLTYYNPSSVTNPQDIVEGYPGQLHEQKDIDPANNSVLRSASYVYFNQDTTGIHMKPNDFKNYNEGNIKEYTDAKGNKTKYYYNVISRTEEEGFYCGNTDEENCPYKVSFHVLKDDGTEVIQKSSWQDYRLPTRIDGYYSQSDYNTSYQLYNQIGNPLKIISPNRYLSNVTYENYYRLGTITLPYDFGNTPPDTIINIEPYSTNFQISSKMTYWGGRDEINNDNSFLSNDTLTYYLGPRIENRYNLEISDNLYEMRYNMLIKFDNSKYSNISVIDSAFFEFSPYYATEKLDNVLINDYNIYLTPLSLLSGSGESMIYADGVGILNAGNIGTSSNTSCAISLQGMMNQYNSNFKKISVTQLLNNNIVNNTLNLQGMKLSMTYTGSSEKGILDFMMPLYACPGFGFFNHYNNYSPTLKIYARYNSADTIIKINYNTGTVINSYDDINNIVTSKSKIDMSGSSNRWKTTENYFDSFGKLINSRLYTDASNYNESSINYNYLDLKARITDPRTNQTKLSYDKYGNVSKTQNPDNSYSLVSETYYNGYTNTFGLVPGMILKKVLTDEVGNTFEKFYDALGNLIREIKYVEGIPSDNPEEQVIPLTTDYKYDDLYRVIEVKTPNEKYIYYTYDGLGRQSSRTTPDAGEVKYKYDKNDNLRFSQDNNQANKPTETPPSKFISYRGYDGLNRLLYLCDAYGETYLVPWSNLNPDNTYYFDSYSYTPNNFLVINVYDSLTNYPANANIFEYHKPADYYTNAPYSTNNTKGSLCATAYRTVGTDSLSFKYYRYDARGRVIKMWNYIAGLGMKTFDYNYNSQNQITELIYQSGYSDTKSFKYAYDYAGRLLNTSFNYIPSDSPEEYITFNSYTYNQNSQIYTSKFDPINLTHTYSYDNRSRITNYACGKPDLFSYNLTYFANSNIYTQSFTGQYKNSFSNQDNLSTSFNYDKSNRLLNANFTHTSDNTFDLTNTYDPDGNILTMQRYGSNNNLLDNFSYDYYSGTNRLKKVSGSSDQYTYDYNGNQTNDYLAENTGISYDHRNLITEITRGDNTTDPPATIKIRYKYDESGNRIRKTIYRSTESNPPPLPEETEDLPTGWSIILDDYYLREVSGKEIAIYSSYTLQYWNVWSGSEIVGRINNSENVDRNYYLKDHLGSIRVVLDNSKTIISANDYDMWGYYLQNRTYSPTNTKNKFTGKERDLESSYDYFGARYYDARIGRWGQTDPLMEKHIQWSPYNYVLGNPIALIDPDGRQNISIFGEIAVEATKISFPWIGIPLTPVGAIISIIAHPNVLGTKDVKESIYFDKDENGVLVYIFPIEEIQIMGLETSRKSREEGMENKIQQIEGHLINLEGKGKPNPNGENNNHWKGEIKGFYKDLIKDAKKILRNKRDNNELEYLKNKFGKDRIENILKQLKNFDI